MVFAHVFHHSDRRQEHILRLLHHSCIIGVNLEIAGALFPLWSIVVGDIRGVIAPHIVGKSTLWVLRRALNSLLFRVHCDIWPRSMRTSPHSNLQDSENAWRSIMIVGVLRVSSCRCMCFSAISAASCQRLEIHMGVCKGYSGLDSEAAIFERVNKVRVQDAVVLVRTDFDRPFPIGYRGLSVNCP